MADKSQDYRLKAVACGQRAKEAPERITRQEWEELAMQWHLLAHQAAQMSGAASQNDNNSTSRPRNAR
jgi:hypothetical protein